MAQSLKTDSLHDRDFFAWTQDQAEKLRARASFDNRGDIDWENAAEEIESLGDSVRNAIESRIAVLVLHLLKGRYQPGRRSGSLKGTIVEQHGRIARRLRRSPSLRPYPAEALVEEYESASPRCRRDRSAGRRFPLPMPLHDRGGSRSRFLSRYGDMMRSIVVCLVLAAAPSAAVAAEIVLDLPGALDRQSVSYACSDGSAPKVAYYNLPDQSFAVVEIEAGKPRVFVPGMAASGAKYVSGPYVFWTRGSRADISDERKADAPAVTCKVAR